MQEVLSWLGKQIDANDPSKAGAQGAYRLADAAAALSPPRPREPMAFGLVVEPAALAHVEPLVGRMKALLGAHLATLGPDELEIMRQHVGHRLTKLGLGIAAPPPPTATHTITLVYPLSYPAVVHLDTDEERDMTTEEKRCFDGVRPYDHHQGIADLPCFADLDWLIDAQVALRFEDGDLFCHLELSTCSAPSEGDLAALKTTVSRDLWGSGWSLNLEWDDVEAREISEIGDDRFANLTVDERPKSVTVSANA